MNRIKEIQKLLEKEEWGVIITKDTAWLNGDAFDIVVGIQKVLEGIIETGFPKDLAKELIEIAFMTDEEKEEKLEKELKRLQKNLSNLLKEISEE